ncbi:efflux RND transporter periplasmic adaptor subunit [Acidihalobacter prosperus]|uniref:Multidrug resistance protein MdtA-like C-terminal permuted SH3 domain-containing protein n=1 Tax=Acidihalobacter prosperus TaxID=160660 RepID=A0A1A6C1Z8_9GAMM|nr:HlyD family efflux transporter periplasmic adaptor subunit [Acidihalobacter prosperus]OBS08574.1 hypothetical protein Thpro_022824 [Acidihalobacter prosperus]
MNAYATLRLRRWLWLCALPWAAAQAGTPITTRAQTVTYRPTYTAYAEVVPLHWITLRADHAGLIDKLTLLPGSRVHSGEILARLTGPDATADLAHAKARLAAARQHATLAADSLHSAQRTYPAFTDRRALDRAKAAQVDARIALRQAEVALARLRRQLVLRSPADAQVVDLDAGNGERVDTGSAILRLLPDNALWLRATYYGDDAHDIASGLAGRFLPADGDAPVAVRVVSTLPQRRSDGGRDIGLRASGTVHWIVGERGRVVLYGPARPAVTVPTSALIFDQGRWWVLAMRHDQPQRTQVTPGPSRGPQTLILSGLTAGTQVVVRNAYLLFHRDFAAHYTPPD